jgi:hypothetical protein
MKIKILNISDVRKVQEIFRDLSIEQPTYGYSDVFTVPDDEDESEYLFDVLKQQNIKWVKVNNESRYKNSTKIRKIIQEMRLNELNLSIKEYEKFINKVERDGIKKSGSYDVADPTAFTKTTCDYQVGNKLFQVTVIDVTWGYEIDIRLYDGSTEVKTIGSVYVDEDTGTPQNKRNKQVFHKNKNPQFVISSIYEIMKNGRKTTFHNWAKTLK